MQILGLRPLIATIPIILVLFPDEASSLPCSPFAALTPQRLAGAHGRDEIGEIVTASCRLFPNYEILR